MDSIILIVIYSILITVCAYSVFLYRKAYYEMKKTRVIKSVYLLLIALLAENFYFGLALLCQNQNLLLYNYLIQPFWWIFPKLFILIALIYFIYSSLTKSEYVPNTVNKDKIFK